MTPIIINLSKSQNARVFKEGSLIHYNEFEKVSRWIQERVDMLNTKGESVPKEDPKERFQDTISILGTRGSGKTSFIKSLLERYEKRDDIAVIDIIDPTLIEEKGHIFLTIIAQIAKMVEKRMHTNKWDTEDAICFIKKKWDNKLKELASGIPSIDGIGSGFETWQDPEFIMHRGLKSVQSAKSLEKNFHHLIELSLKILEKKLFILSLDDIDIDFSKGWPVLETIRKYLTSPRIITLLSGNMKLFSTAVRKQQWKNFDKPLLINEGEKLRRIADYNDLVTEMGGQYLQKVMKPQRRVYLTSLYEKIYLQTEENQGIYIKIEKDGREDKTEIREYYDGILSRFGMVNASQVEAYRSFLLSLPIRTQIQFLLAFENESSIRKVNVTEAFLSDLYEKRVDVETVKYSCKLLIAIILKLLADEKLLDEVYQLQPTTTDISLNSSLLATGLLLSKQTMDHPYLIFDYFLKIGYARNLLTILDYQEEEKGKAASLKSPSMEGLLKHAGVFQDRDLRNICGSMTAYTRAALNSIEKEKRSKNKNNDKDWGGTITLPGFAFIGKQGKEDSSERIDTILKKESFFNQCVGYIPLSVSQPNYKTSSLPTYSIYAVIATIGDIIRHIQTINENHNEVLNQLSQVRSYPMPNFTNYTSDPGEPQVVVFEPSELEEVAQEQGGDLMNLMGEWVTAYKNIPVAPYLLGKISTRFFYALQSVEQRQSSKNLGDAMHHRMIILLNSILLEDVRENIKSENIVLNNNNPRENDEIFIYNLNKVLNFTPEQKEKLQFSKWMLSCPLFLLYLNMSEVKNKNLLLDYIKSKEEESEKKTEFYGKTALDASIYDLLKMVAIKDSSKIPFSGNHPKLEATISVLQKYYIKPADFIGSSTEDIKSKVKHEFESVRIPSINKIKEIYQGKESWLPILS